MPYLTEPDGSYLTTADGSRIVVLVDAQGNVTLQLVPGGAPGVRGDIATIWQPADGRGDWVAIGPGLVSGGNLATAVLISLFSDRSALPEDAIPDGTTDRRGWWGDLGQDVPIGSRLWLLDRAKQTDQTLARAKDYMAEALQWLIDDGVAGAIDIYAEWTRPGMLGARVTLHQPGRTAPTTLNFNWAWQEIA